MTFVSIGVYSIVEEMGLDLPQPECLFDIHYFRDDPSQFYRFAHKLYPEAKTEICPNGSPTLPSFTHVFLRELEKRRKLQRVYTQNIDALEKRAGIKRVVFCHGSLNEAQCLDCKKKVSCSQIMESVSMGTVATCAKPNCGGVMKPCITFFGEDVGNKISKTISVDSKKADLILVIGTSLKVAPVSNLPCMFPPSTPIALINKNKVELRKSKPPSSQSEVQFHLEILNDCDLALRQVAAMLHYTSLEKEENTS
mmetsp:Transcript_19824/g.25686  ORF Transcript_19824/g.25686 Transcript_19824/m.25686 type:complete len:253 (-) Transcript_19824:1184-1942(-)